MWLELKADSSPQPLQKPSPSNRPSTSLCSPPASPCLPHTGWPSAGTNTASCSLRSWGWLPREWPLGALRRSDTLTDSHCSNTWKPDMLVIQESGAQAFRPFGTQTKLFNQGSLSSSSRKVASFVKGLPGCKEHAATFKTEVITSLSSSSIRNVNVCQLFFLFSK